MALQNLLKRSVVKDFEKKKKNLEALYDLHLSDKFIKIHYEIMFKLIYGIIFLPKFSLSVLSSCFYTLTPVVFPKIHLLERGRSPGFLWLLILLLVTSFLKIILKFLKSFRKYEGFLQQFSPWIFIGSFDISLLQRN